MRFLRTLRELRWDDHRFYHHNRVNQSLHLLSAICFLATYVLLFTDPVAAGLFGWIFAMCLRQAGHFFFEPKGFDEVHQVSHEFKEEAKAGFNLRRKVILHGVWALVPIALLLQPSLFGLIEPHAGWAGYLERVSTMWIALAGIALVGRTVQLFFLRDVVTGLAWFAKILTDPYHDIKLYWRAPLRLLRGETVEPAHGGPAA